METRVPNLRTLILPVSFAFLFVLLTFLIWRSFGGATPLAPHDYRVALPLTTAQNLYQGSAVQISGVEVGRVVDIERAGNEARATIELERRYAPIRTGATVIPRTKSLLGEGYIEIAPGPSDAPVLEEGAQLPRKQVRNAESLDDVLQTFDPATRRNFRRFFTGMAQAFDDRAEDLSAVLARSAPASRSLHDVLATLDAERPALQQLVHNSADVLAAAGGREGELEAAVRSGNAVLETTARNQERLAATMRALPPFLTEWRRASEILGASSGDLERAVSALGRLSPELVPALRATSAAAPDFRGLLRELPPVLDVARRGVPALRNITAAVEPSFADIYEGTRELIPLMQLLAEIRDSAVGGLVNVASGTNIRYRLPGGRIGATASGITTVWNESIVGWKKKLPSSRPNPYPRPRAPLEIANGALPSYDCRHLGNTLYLPPTGGEGATPCRLQGPWELNGQSRYYPRLELAPP